VKSISYKRRFKVPKTPRRGEEEDESPAEETRDKEKLLKKQFRQRAQG